MFKNKIPKKIKMITNLIWLYFANAVYESIIFCDVFILESRNAFIKCTLFNMGENNHGSKKILCVLFPKENLNSHLQPVFFISKSRKCYCHLIKNLLQTFISKFPCPRLSRKKCRLSIL